MKLFELFCTILGCYIGFLVEVQSEELSVDPLSIFVDHNLYKFCWNQDGRLYNDYITVTDAIVKTQRNFTAVQDDQFSERTFCIENREKTKTYIVDLPMTNLTKFPKIISFKIPFYQPLGPHLDIIQFRTVPGGIHVELNFNLAGLKDFVGGSCDVLLIIEHNRKKTFDLFKLLLPSDRTYRLTKAGSSFTLYYTCDIPKFSASTRFGIKNGFLGFENKTNDLQPIILMPFRRFIMATWKHPINESRRYDVAIYEQLPNNANICVKLFRIFTNTFWNGMTSPKQLASNCEKNASIEDLGGFNDVETGFITVILDMIRPLKMYRKYRLEIFWKDSSDQTMNNYLPLTTLPNENSWVLSHTILAPRRMKYEDMINVVPNLDQSVLSANNANPYLGAELKMSPYNLMVVLPSITTNITLSVHTSTIFQVSALYEKYKQLQSSQNFAPYFYVTYLLQPTPTAEIIAEIAQFPIPQDVSFGIEDLQFEPNNNDFYFTVSWKISKHPNSTTPAIFGATIRYESNDTCHIVYYMKCRTCNLNYMEGTILQTKSNKGYLDGICKSTKELSGHYDAIDSSIKFKTEKMPPFVNFKVQIYSFKFNVVSKSESSKANYITESGWQKYGSAVICILSALLAISCIIVLYLFCKRTAQKPVVTKEKEDSNMYEQEDET